jgi:hypothetical protein
MTTSLALLGGVLVSTTPSLLLLQCGRLCNVLQIEQLPSASAWDTFSLCYIASLFKLVSLVSLQLT